MTRDKVTELELPDFGKFHHYLIINDMHCKEMYRNGYEIFKKYSRSIPKYQRRLIINGDLFDAPFLMFKNSEFKKWIKRNNSIEEFFLREADKEFLIVNKILDELGLIFDEIIYIEGNHCKRYAVFADSNHCPLAYQNKFNIQKRLNLKEREILFVNHNDWLDIGKVTITHGMYTGRDCHKRHFLAALKSVIFADVHSAETLSFTVRDGTKKAWSLPCMCSMNPKYLNNIENNWTQGFSHLIMKHSGNFQLNIHEIWDDELIYNNKIIKP